MHRILTALVLTLATLSTAAAVPLSLSHQGRMFDQQGLPLDGDHEISVSLYDAAASGNMLWNDTFTAVTFEQGYFHLELGSNAALSALAFDGDDVFLELAIDSAPALGRTQIGSVPFAVRAQSAYDLVGGTVNASEIQVNGTTVINSSGEIVGASGTLSALSCAADQVALSDGSDWACGDRDVAHTHGADDIDAGVLSIDRLPVGTSSGLVAPGDHIHALGDLSGTIAEAQLPSNIGAIVDGYVVDGALDLDGGTTIGGAPIAIGTHSHALSDLSGAITGTQLPSDIGAIVDGYVEDGALDLDAGTTIGGAEISTGDHFGDADAVSALEDASGVDFAAIITDPRTYYHDYAINTAGPKPILNRRGVPVGRNYQAMIHCSVTGTNAPGNSFWMVKTWSNGSISVEKLASFGSTGSNTPQLYNNGGVLSIRLYAHTSTYTVRCRQESLVGGE